MDEEGYRSFLVNIKDVRATKLPKKDVFSKCDSYVVFSSKLTETFQTPICYKNYNPVYEGFEHQVLIDFKDVPNVTSRIDVEKYLLTNLLTLECFAQHSLRKDSLIGKCRVDFLSLAAGPLNQKLTLFNERKQPVGQIEFSVEVRCETSTIVSLSDLQCFMKKKVPANYFLNCQLASELKEVNTPICFQTTAPFWPVLPTYSVKGDLVSLFGELLKLTLFSVTSRGALPVGTCEVRLQKYNTPNEKEKILFREYLKSTEDDTVMGIAEGYLSYDNLPLPCQMQGGMHQDESFIDAAPMLDNLNQFPTKVLQLIPPVIAPYDPELLPKNEYAIPQSKVVQEEVTKLVEALHSTEVLASWIPTLEALTKLLKGMMRQMGIGWF